LEKERTMFWKREAISARRLTGSDVRCTLLLSAMRAFRQAEIEAAKDPSRQGRVMAEFAELVVLPGLSKR
jgi:hypothetical protein